MLQTRIQIKHGYQLSVNSFQLQEVFDSSKAPLSDD